MDGNEAQAQSSQSAAPATGADSPQIDIGNVTIDQLDGLFETGTAELPVKASGGESQVVDAPAGAEKKDDPPAGDTPPVVVDPPVVEAAETRTPEEIETAATAAIEKVKADGGDQAAQDAAAEAARAPGAPKVEAPPAPKVEEPPKVEDELQLVQRPRLKDPIDQQIAAVFKAAELSGTKISWAEAERRVKGDAAAAVKTDDPPVVVPDLTTTVSTLESEIADIETRLTTAGADEGLYNAEIAKLNIEHTKKVAALETAKLRLADAQADAKDEAEEADTAWKTAAAESRAQALELYPAIADKSTPLGKAVSERIEKLNDPKNPDHNILFAASAALTIAAQEAEKLGIQPAKKAAAPPPAKPPVVIPPVTKQAPVSGAASSASDANKPEDAKKKTVAYLQSNEASLQDLDAAQGAAEPSDKLKTLLQPLAR
jgi:hypothetical protein